MEIRLWLCSQEALRYCGIFEHHGHVMYVWENTMNIVDICTFVHAINNLVLFRLTIQPLEKILTTINLSQFGHIQYNLTRHANTHLH